LVPYRRPHTGNADARIGIQRVKATAGHIVPTRRKLKATTCAWTAAIFGDWVGI
jgi:hypothetical protein